MSQQVQLSGKVGRRAERWDFGPGGASTLTLQMGFGSFGRPLGPNPFGYSAIEYTTRPFPFTLRPGTTHIGARVGAVPEPATMVLLGTGLLGLFGARRRRETGAAPWQPR